MYRGGVSPTIGCLCKYNAFLIQRRTNEYGLLYNFYLQKDLVLLQLGSETLQVNMHTREVFKSRRYER